MKNYFNLAFDCKKLTLNYGNNKIMRQILQTFQDQQKNGKKGTIFILI